MLRYGFIIDTNEYSGNFERELCAFVTGHIGECGVGDEEAEEFLDGGNTKLPYVMDVADEHGCSRPCEIYPTEGIWNNGMGFHYKESEEELALQKWKDSMTEYKQKNIKMYKSYYKDLPQNWTVEQLDKTIDDLQKDIDEAQTKTEVGKYPAYESVIIYFSRLPDEETINFMKERARMFESEGKQKGLKITGFRILEIQTTSTHRQV